MNLRILFVEDSTDDLEFMLRRLRDDGLEPEWDRVQTDAALRAALAGERWDVALVDYNLPGFGGEHALRVLTEVAPDIPAITVSGTISEETAVATLTAGAVDYVLKSNLTRLAPAVRRAVEGAELRQRQRRAAEQARQTMLAIEHSSQAIVYVGEDAVILYVNEAARRLGGVPAEDVVGERIWGWTPGIDAKRWSELWRLAAEGPIVDVEATVRRSDGEKRLILATLDYQEREEGAFVIVYARDITEQRAVEERAHASDAQLRTLIDTLPDLVWLKDPDGVYLSCNLRFESCFGSSEADIVGKTDYDFTNRDLADSFRRNDQAAIEAGGPMTNEEEVVFAEDGHKETLETIKTPVYGDGGRLVGVLGVGRDITERKRAEEGVLRQAEHLRRTVEGAVLAMSQVVETRDPYTAGHERRVAELATAIATEMGLEGEEISALRHAGLIHDIGKIAVPAEILAKPGRLSEFEFELIKEHARAGFEILAAIDFGRPVAEMVLQHHERLDGSGYPKALAAADILPEAKILAVADVVEAMSSHRPYRAALGMEAALAEIRAQAGVKYDADVAAACFRVIEELGFRFTP